jgi:integrase
MQALVRKLSDDGMAPATIESTYRAVAAVLKAAVVDRVIAVSPAVGVKVPRADRPKVNPLEADHVLAFAEAVPARTRVAVLFAAGSGLRMGEVLGLTVDRIDFLRRTGTVDRQLLTPPNGGEPTFGPPKTKASHRVVPLAQVTVDMLAAHLAEFPAGRDGLVHEPTGRAVAPQHVREVDRPRTDNGRSPGLGAVPRSAPPLRVGTHRCGLLVQGRPVALGHANASETLDTYSHLWPADEDRIREAVQALHGSSRVTAVSRPAGTTS